MSPSTSSGPSMNGPSVTRLSVTPIKGTRLQCVDAITLERGGAVGDRRFFLIDGKDRMLNGKKYGALQEVSAELDAATQRLTVSFPDRSVASGDVREGPEITVGFFSRETTGRLIEGPWSEAISAHVGAELRLVEIIGGADRGSAVDRGYLGAVSLVSQGSLARLAREAEVDAVDSRRFRMLIEIDGVQPHAEDAWVNETFRIGDALVRFQGHVGRCVVTTRSPDSGVVDLPTLKLLARYRRDIESSEPLPFGIYGEVLQAGTVRIGDAVTAVS